ncbi:MAG: Flp pilus assembly protein CpaB [Pseudomonadota bacterium]|nr:Flp pilus assembly protein CpaB [Pseudomonadota bacterium]
MSPMRLIILAVALIAAVAAAFLVRNMANQQPTVVTGPTQTVEKIVEVEVSQQKVLVAKGDLRVGTLLTPDDFKWANWPEETVNPAYFTQDFAPDAMETLTGSVVRVAMYVDEPIMPQKIVQKGETGFMAALLAPGKRAVTVEISPESASAGFILPDDRVDIILTEVVQQVGTDEDAPPITVTTTILENGRVLAIDQTFGDVDGIPTLTGSTATMELTQNQAELLARAARVGELSLTLRSAADAGFNEGEALANVDSLDQVRSGSSKVMIYRSNKVEAGGT